MQVYCDFANCEYNEDGCCYKERISLDSNGVCCNVRIRVDDDDDESEE